MIIICESNYLQKNQKKECSTEILSFLMIFFTGMFIWCGSVFAEESLRSSSLECVVTTEGDIQRTDYVNLEGDITYAADKHYATVIKTSSNHTLLEEYFDADGKPALQSLGYYALFREYNDKGQNFRVTYLDKEGKPVIIRLGYAILERTFNADGRVELELYYGKNGRPIDTRKLGYGCYKEYNKEGRNTLVAYINRDGDIAICEQGFAIMHRSYYEAEPNIGRVEYEFYFNANEEPISLSHGQYGVHMEYDDLGRVNVLTFLNAQGQPITTVEGFTIIRRTFYEDDSINYEFYFDINGNPVSLSEGQYGIQNINGTKIFLDVNGNRLFNLRNYLFANQLTVIMIGTIVVFVSLFFDKKMNYILIFLYIVFIIYMTLLFRESGMEKYNFDLFWSYKQFFKDVELRWEILNNIFLFIPLGTILYCIFPQKRILILPIVFSMIIEVIQLRLGIGLCEFDDIISNGFGAAIGFCVGAGTYGKRIFENKKLKMKKGIDNKSGKKTEGTTESDLIICPRTNAQSQGRDDS